jgi:hypothetical protein
MEAVICLIGLDIERPIRSARMPTITAESAMAVCMPARVVSPISSLLLVASSLAFAVFARMESI